MKKKYDKPVEIMDNFIQRYNIMMPGFLTKLKKYEDELVINNRNHVLSIDDCKTFITDNYIEGLYKLDDIIRTRDIRIRAAFKENRLTVLAECILLLYQWYKRKIIYIIDPGTTQNQVSVNKEKLSKIPYNGFLVFYSAEREKNYGYLFCKIRKKQEFSFMNCLMIGFIYYDSQAGIYSIEPYELSIRPQISIQNSFREAMRNEINYNILEQLISGKKSILPDINKAIIILYNIIEVLDKEKIEKESTGIRRKVTQATIIKTKGKNNEYTISYIPKFWYSNKSNTRICGTPKRPHARKAFDRTISVKDKDGNIISSREVPVRETQVHKDEMVDTITIKPINN